MEQPGLKEIFNVDGGAPDPAGTDMRGVAPGYDLSESALGHPMVLYRSRGKTVMLELDVHPLPEDPSKIYIHIRCPVCIANGHRTMLRIVQGQKPMLYEPLVAPPVWPDWTREQMNAAYLEAKGRLPQGAGGRISIEPFRCTFETQPENRRSFGLAQCTWQVEIDNNIARDV